MKSLIIEQLGKFGGYQIARWLTRNEPKILMYHRFSAEKKGLAVTEATFEIQLQLIKRYFNPMTLAQLAQAIKTNNKVPAHAVVITVDDGYRDFYEVAYPLLKRYQVPATFFVTTGFVNGDLWLWPDQVSWLLESKPDGLGEITFGALRVNLDEPANKIWWPIVGHFLNVPNTDRLQYLQQLATACNLNIPVIAPTEYAAVSWNELAEMQANGIEIGGHTVSHPSLGHMPIEESAHEINQSWQDLNRHLGEQERTFCYPNGQPGDYSDEIKQQVGQSPYSAAVTAYSDKFNTKIPYAWRRFVGCEERFQFHKSLFGVEHLGNRIRNTRRCSY